MTQPTDKDIQIAGKVCEAWRRNPGMAGDPDLQTRIATALAEARTEAYRKGFEDGRKSG